MKKDFYKIIVERPRLGGGNSRPGRHSKAYLNDDDDEKYSRPRKEGIKKLHGNSKSLNENLNPLKRFLESKVGCNWDSVYSEICEHITVDSAVQKHVRDHVYDFVFQNATKNPDGTVTAISRYSNSYQLWKGDLYIEDGILKQVKFGRCRNAYRSTYIPPPKDFLERIAYEVNKVYGTERTKMEVKQGVLYKVFPNPINDKIELYNIATDKHLPHRVSYRIHECDKLSFNRFIADNRQLFKASESTFVQALLQRFEVQEQYEKEQKHRAKAATSKV